MAEGFAQNYPEDESTFKKNLDALEADLDANIARWEREAAPLKGKKLVSYHPDMVYFAERFGMEPVGTIEIRAGVDPTPSHIEELIDRMKREKVDIVVRERHYPAGLAETIAQRTGAKLVELPVMVGGVPRGEGLRRLHRLQPAGDAQGRAGWRMSAALIELARRQPRLRRRAGAHRRLVRDRARRVRGARRSERRRQDDAAARHPRARPGAGGADRLRLRPRRQPAGVRAAARHARSDLPAERLRGRAHGHVRQAAAAAARAAGGSASSRAECLERGRPRGAGQAASSGSCRAGRSSAC